MTRLQPVSSRDNLARLNHLASIFSGEPTRDKIVASIISGDSDHNYITASIFPGEPAYD